MAFTRPSLVGLPTSPGSGAVDRTVAAGRAWALVLTHDVETAEGLRLIPVLANVEERRGYVSSWNFVPKRYDVPESVLTELANRGCEVGIHGLYHDGRDLESARMLQERLPEMIRYAKQWGAAASGPLLPSAAGISLPPCRLITTRHTRTPTLSSHKVEDVAAGCRS